MIGRIVGFDPPLHFCCVSACVAGNYAAIGKLHDQRGIVGSTVEIDQQTGPTRHDCGRAKFACQRPGYFSRSDVRSDVRLEEVR